MLSISLAVDELGGEFGFPIDGAWDADRLQTSWKAYNPLGPIPQPSKDYLVL